MTGPAVRPSWLNKKIDLKACRAMDTLTERLALKTVCRAALCPNMSECFSRGVAAFLMMGSVCTRRCGFCAVAKGRPEEPDPREPRRVAAAVKELGLRHAVITSVTRDDLPDGGAGIFAETISCIKQVSRDITIETLVPDFGGSAASVETVLAAGPDIFAHNVETVPGLYPRARAGADYERSVSLLSRAKRSRADILTKSGIMLGLGETGREVLSVFDDLRTACCDFLSIGQYLSPGKGYIPVAEYIPPAMFLYYKERAMEKGFASVESGPYVRSSYMAHKYLEHSPAAIYNICRKGDPI